MKIQTPEDIVWTEYHPNDIRENPLEGYDAEICFSKNSYRKYMIRFQKAAIKEEDMSEKIKKDLYDPNNPTNILNYGGSLVGSDVELYILFEQFINVDDNGTKRVGDKLFVRAFDTLEEARYRAFIQYRHIQNLVNSFC